MGAKFVLEVVASVLGATWWMVAVLLLLAIITFRRPIAAGWGRLTEKVIWWLTWIHLRNQLPEDLKGPFGWHGGGKQTFDLGEGEKLELVLVPAPKSVWFSRPMVVNPDRRDDQGKPAQSFLPPLCFGLIIYPALAVAVTILGWFILWFFSRVPSSLAPQVAITSAALGSLLLMAPTFWLYEFNRRNTRLVVTTLMGYILIIRALTRELHRSLSPLINIEETRVDSAWSESQNIVLRTAGGWIQELRDWGNIFFGTRVQRMGDLLKIFPSITALEEIVKTLNGDAKGYDDAKKMALKMAQEAIYKGHAAEALAGTTVAGGRSPLLDAMREAEAIMNAWRAEHPDPEGATINLTDPRIRGFTLWNLENGERLEEAA